jgi:hypothetical protein
VESEQDAEPKQFAVGQDSVRVENFELLVEKANESPITPTLLSVPFVEAKSGLAALVGFSVDFTLFAKDAFWKASINFPYSYDFKNPWGTGWDELRKDVTTGEALEVLARQLPGVQVSGPRLNRSDWRSAVPYVLHEYLFDDVKVGFWDAVPKHVSVETHRPFTGEKQREYEHFKSFAQVFAFVARRVAPFEGGRKYILDPLGKGRVVDTPND